MILPLMILPFLLAQNYQGGTIAKHSQSLRCRARRRASPYTMIKRRAFVPKILVRSQTHLNLQLSTRNLQLLARFPTRLRRQLSRPIQA
jgi:hypothetical protein